MSLLSGLVNCRTIGNIGMDNRAAGYLLGRPTKQRGIIAVVSGGGLYRGHEYREIGFGTVVRDEFKHIDGINSLAKHSGALLN